MTREYKDMLTAGEYEDAVVNAHRLINALRAEFPQFFIIEESVMIPGMKRWFPVGIFACTICLEPISHNQFAFSRCCGGCDTGRKKELWTIVKPSEGGHGFKPLSNQEDE